MCATRLNLVLYGSTKRIGPHWPFFIEIPFDAPSRSCAAQESANLGGCENEENQRTGETESQYQLFKKLTQRDNPLKHSEPTGLTTAE